MNDNLDAAVALMDGAPELINEPMTSELFQGSPPLRVESAALELTVVAYIFWESVFVMSQRPPLIRPPG